MDIKLPFGLKNNTLVHISEVDSGLECNCICPACKSRLVARKGSKMKHHFAHYNSEECKNSIETALHLASKKIFEEGKRILLPKVEIELNCNRKPLLLSDAQEIQFDEIRVEYRIDDIIPDIILITNGKPLAIEIKVTHGIDYEKLNKIRSLDISTLEIDLSKVDREIDYSSLNQIIVEGLDCKKWVYNSKVSKIEDNLISICDKKNYIMRGMALHVDHCPINARVWKGKSYANVIDDCIYCEYCFGSEQTDYNGNGYVYCLGTLRISSYTDYLKRHKNS